MRVSNKEKMTKNTKKQNAKKDKEQGNKKKR